MRLRSLLRIAAMTAAIALASTACAGQGQGSGETGDSGGPVTLKFWNGFTGPDRAAVEGIVSKYNASQSKAKIEMEIMPWDVFFDKLLPSLGSGTGPDIAAMDTAQIPQRGACSSRWTTPTARRGSTRTCWCAAPSTPPPSRARSTAFR